jgi:hypothetical protein
MRAYQPGASGAFRNSGGPPGSRHCGRVNPKCPAVIIYISLIVQVIAITRTVNVYSQDRGPVRQDSSSTKLVQFVSLVRGRAKAPENSTGMRLGFRSFMSAHNLAIDSISYSDFVVVRVLFEATRDAGFWNLHWSITDQPPNSDRIWSQWLTVGRPSPVTPTATAECDELSALYAFLAERAGVKSVGLFWPFPNHTVAVWVVRPVKSASIRVVVPTPRFSWTKWTSSTRENSTLGGKKPFTSTRVATCRIRSKSLSCFSIFSSNKWTSMAALLILTLQQLRYLREGVFLKSWTREEAARTALRRRSKLVSGAPEDLAAFENFAQDMRTDIR